MAKQIRTIEDDSLVLRQGMTSGPVHPVYRDMTVGGKQRVLNALAERLDAEARGKCCLRCKGRVWRAFINQTWQLRCNCYPKAEPKPYKARDDAAERLGKMVLEHSREQQKTAGAMARLEEGQGLVPTRAMTIAEFDERQALILHVCQAMSENVHYGVIPGTADKSLWEAGAEYLRAAFNIQWDYDLVKEVENFETWDFRYEFRVHQLLGVGIPTGGWIGSAWSRERRFYCRRECPKPCPQDHEPKGMEREMLPHNVKDRALKRAFVAMVRNVTGTTGHFKQALDQGEGEAGQPEEGQRTISSPDARTIPITSVCPQHKIAWVEGKWGRYHIIAKGQPLCSLKKVYGHLLEEAFAASGQPDDLASFIKLRFGTSESRLSDEQTLEAYRLLSEVAVGLSLSRQPTPSHPSPADGIESSVDTEEGPEGP